ncbi:hypothetical protein COL26_27055 [Bacillus thuringiensis]|uniref:Uncharacterized protein n=1 Tax=Bacillus thuringiensis TaxID=1428 RepID=A0ABD6S929_BACTU|nr:hypothetical protein CN495_09060 [Bacillus thuringiensis]PFW30573.1 hypothetical protein COL26_27055 [Bacillus thuringiensis]
MFYKLYKYLNLVLLFTYEHLKKTLQKVHLLRACEESEVINDGVIPERIVKTLLVVIEKQK